MEFSLEINKRVVLNNAACWYSMAIFNLYYVLPQLSKNDDEEQGSKGFQVNSQRYKYRVLQTIQMKLILLCVWAEPAVLGSAKTALKFKYEI